MNVVIHDLNESEWNKVKKKYSGWKVISDTGNIRPCVGCFGCWIKNPGQCVIKDGYDRMGALIHTADEVVIISRYTYGGFSSFVKNVMDRSISWVLPYFEIYEGEMHHRKRYPEDKPITFVFRGCSFTAAEKKKARSYTEAVCRNFHGKVKDLTFVKCEPVERDTQNTDCEPDRIILLNGSLRGDEANSRRFMTKLVGGLDGEPEMINLSSYIKRQDELIRLLLSARTLVMGMPMYVDGIPSQVLRIMEKLEQDPGKEKKVYTLANMGFYESRQIRNLLGMVKDWSDRCGYDYCGGLAIGAGEMMGMFMNPKSNGKGPAKYVFDGMDKLAAAINTSSRTDDIYADACMFPRRLYMIAANSGWPKAGRNNGLKKKDLLRKDSLVTEPDVHHSHPI